MPTDILCVGNPLYLQGLSWWPVSITLQSPCQGKQVLSGTTYSQASYSKRRLSSQGKLYGKLVSTAIGLQLTKG